MAWRGSSPNDSGVMQPGIDISSYATPVAANKDLVAVAVLYLTKDEADAIKEFARQVKNKRGNKGVQSVTIAWGNRVSTKNVVPEQEGGDFATGDMASPDVNLPEPTWSVDSYNNDLTLASLIVRSGQKPDNWQVFRMMDGGWSLISPDGDVYRATEDGRCERETFRCNKGHVLPSDVSWCTICEERGPQKPLVNKTPRPVEPERDRFSGLEF